MPGRANFRQSGAGHIQGPTNRTNGPQAYQYFQNLIFDDASVNATVVMLADLISVRTENFTDFVLAKSAIKKRHPEAKIVQG